MFLKFLEDLKLKIVKRFLITYKNGIRLINLYRSFLLDWLLLGQKWTAQRSGELFDADTVVRVHVYVEKYAARVAYLLELKQLGGHE